MSFTGGDSREGREAAITAKLSRISKQQKITQDSKALELLANYAVDEAQEQKLKLDRRRGNRLHLARTGFTLQKFMSTFSQFMKAYSGLNDVAKGIDNQYGALVTGALSVLFQVRIPFFGWLVHRVPLLLICHRLARISKAVRRR